MSQINADKIANELGTGPVDTDFMTTVRAMAQAIGITDEDLDEIFRHAKTIEA